MFILKRDRTNSFQFKIKTDGDSAIQLPTTNINDIFFLLLYVVCIFYPLGVIRPHFTKNYQYTFCVANMWADSWEPVAENTEWVEHLSGQNSHSVIVEPDRDWSVLQQPHQMQIKIRLMVIYDVSTRIIIAIKTIHNFIYQHLWPQFLCIWNCYF